MIGQATSQPGVTVAVLAGGLGSRLGTDKPTARLAKRSLVSYPLAAARDAGLSGAVVAKRDSVLPPLDCLRIDEPALPRHPLCGLVTALERCAEPVIAVGCDMPFLTGELLAWLGSQRGAVVASVNGRLEPLLARYEPSHLPALREALINERPLRAAVAGLKPRVADERELAGFGDPARLTFNVNTTADLQAAERWLTT